MHLRVHTQNDVDKALPQTGFAVTVPCEFWIAKLNSRTPARGFDVKEDADTWPIDECPQTVGAFVLQCCQRACCATEMCLVPRAQPKPLDLAPREQLKPGSKT